MNTTDPRTGQTASRMQMIVAFTGIVFACVLVLFGLDFAYCVVAGGLLKQNTGFKDVFGPFVVSADGTGTYATAIPATCVKINRDGAAATTKTQAAASTHDGQGWHILTFNGADVGTATSITVRIKVAGKFQVWKTYSVWPSTSHNAIIGNTGGGLRAAVRSWGDTAIPATYTGGYPVVTVKDGTGTGEIDTASGHVAKVLTSAGAAVTSVANNAITAASIADAAIDAATFAAGAINAAAIADAAIDNATFAADVGSTAYATNIIALAVRKALDEINLDHLVAAADADNVADNSIIAKLAAADGDWSNYVPATEALQSLRDRGDAAWVTATGFSTHSAADVWAVATRKLTHLDEDDTAIDLDGSTIGTVTTLTNWHASVTDWTDGGRLDLILDIIAADTTTDIPALLGTPVALDGGAATLAGMLTKMADDNGGADFDAGTDSLQEIRDRGDAAWVTGAGGDPWGTALPGAYGAGTAGKLIGDALAGMIPQTGDSFARLGAPAGASISADVAAVKADTAATLTDTGTTLPATLTTIAGYVDTEVAAIQAVTDKLDTTLVLDGAVYDFTAAALAAAPGGGGSESTVLLSTTVATVNSQTSLVLTAGADVADTYNGCTIVIYDVTNNDFPTVRRVTDYAADQTVTLNVAGAFTVAVGDTVKIFAFREGSMGGP